MKTFKHLFTVLLLLCSITASAQSFEVDAINYYVTSSTDKTVRVESRTNKYTGDVVIPEGVTYGDVVYSVTSIGQSAFQDCTGLTSVVIPNSVTIIGQSAFQGCSGLTSVVIGNRVTSIGYSAFYGCSALTGNLVIPNSVTNISKRAFYGCSALTGELLIPNSVTTIGELAFYCCSGFTKLIIGDSVKIIEDNTFAGCTGLTSVVIPNSVTSIRQSAFYDCSALKSLTFGNSITSVYGSAFQNCSSIADIYISDLAAWCNISFGSYLPGGNKNLYLNGKLVTELVVPDGLTEIKDYIFYGFSGLAGNLVIPAGVTSIGSSAFYGCKGLSGDLVLPESLTTIGSSAFCNCSGLTGDLVIPAGVTSIGNSVFSGCSGLTGDLVIPAGVTSIGDYAFYNCSGLSGDLVIPAGVTSIGDYAFYNCSGLSGDLVIPAGVTSIGKSVFSGCSGFTGELVIPASVTSIGDYAFENCSGFTGEAWVAGVANFGRAFNGCSSIESIVIGEGTTSISDKAFLGCSSLKSITIPSTMKSISASNLSNPFPSTIENVYITDLSSWVNIDFTHTYSNPLYYADNLFLNGERITEIVIPENVKEIKKYAFYNCSFITDVTIPGSVTSIGNYAFYKADAVFEFLAETPINNITSYIFGDNAVFLVPSTAVDAYKAAWSTCSARIGDVTHADVAVDVDVKENSSGVLEAIGIDNVSSVVKLAVKGKINSYDIIQFRDKMPLLRELDLSEATVVASDKAFYNGYCTGDNYLGDYTFSGLSNLFYVKLPESLVAIGKGCFSGVNNLRSIELPSTVQSLGGWAFNGCTSLQSVKMPENMQSIGVAAFASCSSLKSIIIPEGVTVLPGTNYSYDGVFYECSALESVVLPYGLQGISHATFYKCKKLKDIKLPPTVKTIEEYAFNGCSSLEEIRIPSSVESIGKSAFRDCSKLNKVYTYTVEPTAIGENTFSTFQTATLYVPSFSFYNYYWDDGWKRFLNLEEFDEPYEYFYVNNDYILDENTGYISGADGNAPDADINAGGGIIIEGEQGDDETPNQSLGDVNVGSNGEGTSGSIIGDNNLHIDDLHIRINVKGGRWYFFAFPFDIFFEDITMENGSDYVFRYYDGEERAQNGKGGWKDINENHLKAARGYIFQCSANDVLVLNIEDVKFKKEDKYNELVAHVSENLKDASWNFTGNPYLSYYDMADMGYTAPVTVWDGSKYVAIRPGDDDYHFAPYEAFFVQKPEGQEAIGFDGEQQMTQNQSEKKMEKQTAARRARSVDTGRMLVNIVLGDGTTSDRTRIVFNERQSLAYETACDATKFETAGVAQIYTIGGDNVHYAINERPADNGRVVLGYSVPAAGMFTIDAARMDVAVVLVDTKNGTVHDFTNGGYTFSSDAGTYNNRFEIKLKAGATGIDEVEGEPTVDAGQNGEVKGEIYDLQGRKLNRTDKGIYIINGEKVMK